MIFGRITINGSEFVFNGVTWKHALRIIRRTLRESQSAGAGA